jgi:hypothetical protein
VATGSERSITKNLVRTVVGASIGLLLANAVFLYFGVIEGETEIAKSLFVSLGLLGLSIAMTFTRTRFPGYPWPYRFAVSLGIIFPFYAIAYLTTSPPISIWNALIIAISTAVIAAFAARR